MSTRELRLRGLALVLLGGAGLGASFALTLDKFKLLADPGFVPGCDLNPVLSCGSVMASDQAEVLGFPNPVIGLVAFAAVVTLGVVQLSGTALAGWVQWGLAAGSALGLGFVHWLAFQSLYRIEALCPWCLVAWAATVPLAVLSVLGAWRASGSTPAVRLWAVRWLIVAGWYLLVVVLALVQFWDYWRTLV